MHKAVIHPIGAVVSAEEFRTEQLGELLRRCRERRPPSAFQIDGSRRKPGLRQEDVAALLHVDVRHYRDFERGRLRRPEPAFLNLVAATLAMSVAEREVLYHLAADHPPPAVAWAERNLVDVRALIDFLPGLPAVVTNMAQDILLWNDHVAQWLTDPATIDPSWRNAMLWMFTAEARAGIPGVEDEYPALVGRIRTAYLCDGARDPALRALVDRLLRIPEAAALWHEGVLALEPVIQRLVIHHPVQGDREVRTLSTIVPQQSLRLLTFTPVGGEAPQASARGTADRAVPRACTG